MITPFTSAIRNNNKPRILIVDDNPRFSHSARLILQQSGQYVVCEENDAAGAVETARSFRPDLTLLDLIKPGVDGAEVAAQIESDWGWLFCSESGFFSLSGVGDDSLPSAVSSYRVARIASGLPD
jgi:CheY-like chemotaxis protein